MYKHLLQGHFQLACGRETFEFAADDPLSIDHKDPWLRMKALLSHRRKELFAGEVLPNLLVRENDPVAVQR
jgi:hypothetical protein